jgi:hypothetical protein
MTKQHTFSRSLVAFSAIFTLATGVASIAAPSTARAETANPIVTLLKVSDPDGLSFRDVAAEVQNGEIVISAEVTAAGTAGRPRTGSIVFTAYSDDGSFMDYTDDACTPSLISKQAGNLACAALSSALRDAAAAASVPTPTVAPAAPTTDGIIMRDGGPCDPIRHMGC